VRGVALSICLFVVAMGVCAKLLCVRESIVMMIVFIRMIRLTVTVSSAASGSGCSLFIHIHNVLVRLIFYD
jgi:hypothetical protein